MRRTDIRIGTSGWHYQHWRGQFYPKDLPTSKMLQYYLQHFDTVELNNSFYRLPSESAYQSWRKAVPSNFLFAVKGSRFLTHMKKLADPEQGIRRFFERAEVLGKKLGPVLFQLPLAGRRILTALADRGDLRGPSSSQGCILFLRDRRISLARGSHIRLHLRPPTWS